MTGARVLEELQARLDAFEAAVTEDVTECHQDVQALLQAVATLTARLEVEPATAAPAERLTDQVVAIQAGPRRSRLDGIEAELVLLREQVAVGRLEVRAQMEALSRWVTGSPSVRPIGRRPSPVGTVPAERDEPPAEPLRTGPHPGAERIRDALTRAVHGPDPAFKENYDPAGIWRDPSARTTFPETIRRVSGGLAGVPTADEVLKWGSPFVPPVAEQEVGTWEGIRFVATSRRPWWRRWWGRTVEAARG